VGNLNGREPSFALLLKVLPLRLTLQGVMLLGKQMDVNYSKHPHINPTQDAHDFSHSNLNRFSRNASKNFRHCCAPTKMIHCSSLPANVTEESITEYLAPHGSITGSKLSENNGKKQALVLFSSEEEATEALVQKHATKFEGSTIRLAFSKLTSL
jgi:polypyrimidine tract-binding protein 2